MNTSILIASLFFFSTNLYAQDPETPVARTTTDEDWGIRKSMEKKKIYQGDWEFEGDFGLGYDRYLGITSELGGKARYFLWDRLSFGFLAGHERWGSSFRTDLGLSARAYLFEFEKWSVSFNQEVTLSHYRAYRNFTQIEGQTGLGLHYYLNPNVALGLHLDSRYSVDSGNAYRPSDLLKTSFGVTFGF